MAISLQQVQRQTQTQRLIMTPQMQQSIQLLQLNSMELEQMIATEMLENPFLELSDDEENLQSGVDGEDARRTGEEEEELDEFLGLSDQMRKEAAAEAALGADFDDGPTDDEAARRELLAPSEGGEPVETTSSTDDFDTFEKNDVDWDTEFSDSDTSAYTGTREDGEDHDFTTYTALSTSLHDNLLRQLRLSSLEGREVEIGEFILGNLDEAGFLDSSIENQARILGYPPELVEAKPMKEAEERLRKMLVKLHGTADAEHYAQLNRRQLAATLVAALVRVSPEEAMAMGRKEQLAHLIARRLRRTAQEVREMREEDLIVECIARRLRVDPQQVFDVLEVIHEFEPTGVGARSLGECLRLQCEEKGIKNRLLYKILDMHLGDLQQKRFREIARAENVPEDDVMEVFHIVSRLDPRPGQSQTKDTPRYITPDVYVKKMDDRYMYFLNEGDAGRLRVASSYRRLVQQKKRHGAAARAAAAASTNGANPHAEEVNRGEVAYAQEKYKNAVWLIKNIEKRKSTVLRVTESIMNYQQEFLDKGIEHLRPLTLRVIAEEVGMHESTIARVTTGKYVETPRGIFELKFFFSSGLETDSGEDASSRSIKEIITQMIAAEDQKRPLSDQKIADMLRDRGIQIARRTVAKYREQLKILPAKLRREVAGQ